MAAIFLEIPPNVADMAPEAAVAKLHSYLYQAAERLNEALSLVDQAVDDTAKAAQEQLDRVTQQMGAATQRMGKSASDALLREAAALQALILDNADTIARVEDRIMQTLRSSYVAQSEFGEYKEDAVRLIEDTADGRIERYNRSETITGLKESAEAAKEFQALYDNYIKTGLLFRDANNVPIYGVAVGQDLQRVTQTVDGKDETVIRTDRVSAVFTATKLSFYQNNQEVAYLSDHQLYIRRAVVLQSFLLGRLLFTVDTTGIAVTWNNQQEV